MGCHLRAQRVPASIMTPVFLVKGTLLRSGIHFRLGLILAVGTAIQAAIIILHPQPDRLLSPTVLTMTAPWLLQTVASPIFTGGGTELLVFSCSGCKAMPPWYWRMSCSC